MQDYEPRILTQEEIDLLVEQMLKDDDFQYIKKAANDALDLLSDRTKWGTSKGNPYEDSQGRRLTADDVYTAGNDEENPQPVKFTAYGATVYCFFKEGATFDQLQELRETFNFCSSKSRYLGGSYERDIDVLKYIVHVCEESFDERAYELEDELKKCNEEVKTLLAQQLA